MVLHIGAHPVDHASAQPGDAIGSAIVSAGSAATLGTEPQWGGQPGCEGRFLSAFTLGSSSATDPWSQP